VHDAELNSRKQIFHPLIHVMLGCFAIDQASGLRLHTESGPSSSSSSLCRFQFGDKGENTVGELREPGGTPRNCTSIAKPDQVTSANPQKDKEMFSVWATNGISRKLLPANALPGRKTFSLSLASGRYAKRPV
jgi:hypothetical protein